MKTSISRLACRTRFGGSLLFLAVSFSLGCADEAGVPEQPRLVLQQPATVTSPAGEGAAQPHLESSPKGDLWMSWMEPVPEGGHALMVSGLDPKSGEWTAPVTISARDDFFVNWADFPSVAVSENGTLFTHWLQKSGEGTYSYDVVISQSDDGGRTWSTPQVLHNDGVESEHGFVSYAPLSSDRMAAVWLDGRHMAGGHGSGGGSMTLRSAELTSDGKIEARAEIDPRVCECCQTSTARMENGDLIALFRDRSDSEIRDIGYSVYSGGEWTPTRILHEDGWKIFGCPVNGPAVDARDGLVAAAWFTGANESEAVNVAFSGDQGESFGDPVRVDLGSPIGRVDIAMLETGAAVVSWLEGAGDGATVMARAVYEDGTMSEPLEIGSTSSARASGFPRMALLGDELYVAWTDPRTETSKVNMSRVSIGRKDA